MLTKVIVSGGVITLTGLAAFTASALTKIARRLYLFHQDYRRVNDLDAREEMDEHLG